MFIGEEWIETVDYVAGPNGAAVPIFRTLPESTSCGHHGHWFGASYPDGICIDGYLWDEDSCDEPGGPLTSGGDIPCPDCNTAAFIESQRDSVRDSGVTAAIDGEPPYPPISRWRECGRQQWSRDWLAGWAEGEAERSGS